MRADNFLLLSIRQPFSRLIILGKKKYELRKRTPKIDCKYALIYETHPTKAIIGMFEINQMHIDSVENIWEITKVWSCVSREFFQEYYKDKKLGVAIEIKNVKKLDIPMSLSGLGINRAPQDFMYVKSNNLEELIRI